MPKVEYQYLLTCPECGGGISMYSKKILTKAQLLQIEATLPATCVLCNMMRQVTMKGGNMSETPRTDNLAMISDELGITDTSYLEESVDLCRQLETKLADKEKQLAEARAEIDGLTLMATNASMEPARRLIQKNKELHAVIEQMREALKALRKYPNTYIATGQGGGIAENDLAMCDAALAAERGASDES